MLATVLSCEKADYESLGSEPLAGAGGGAGVDGSAGSAGARLSGAGGAGGGAGWSAVVEASCVVRVSTTGSDAQSGDSWARAMGSLQGGIDNARTAVEAGLCDSVEVWVEEGTYTPSVTETESDPRAASFRLAPTVAIYGGFDGTESSRSERDSEANETVLSGDIGVAGDDTDNAYHVVTGSDGALLDGFLIARGNADDYTGDDYSYDKSCGGGLYLQAGAMTLAVLRFENNRAGANGGGLFFEDATLDIVDCRFVDNFAGDGAGFAGFSSRVSVRGARFENNEAWFYGGAIRLYESPSAVVSGSWFIHNKAGESGGAINNMYSASRIANSSFAWNSSAEDGGGVFNLGSSPAIVSSTFVGNTAGWYGGAVFNRDGSSPTITHSILWGDRDQTGSNAIHNYTADSVPTVGENLIDGGYAEGEQILTDDPLFVDEAAGDFRLIRESPAVDAGDGCGEEIPLTDIEGGARWDIAGIANGSGAVDWGAYEFQGSEGVDSLLESFGCGG